MANKKTAFISGIVVTLGALFVENNGYNFAWVALLFFPGILIFTIGADPWVAWATNDMTNLVWPNDSASWSTLRSAWFTSKLPGSL